MTQSKGHLKSDILLELARHGILARACRKVEISRQAVYKWRRQDPIFARQYDAAIRKATAQ